MLDAPERPQVPVADPGAAKLALAARERTRPWLLSRRLWSLLWADRAVALLEAVTVLAQSAAALVLGLLAFTLGQEQWALGLVMLLVVVGAWRMAGAYGNVALLAVVDARLSGTPLTAREGLAVAARQWRAIGTFALSGRLGASHRGDDRGELDYVLPIMATEAFDDETMAERRSRDLRRARWGATRTSPTVGRAVMGVGLLVCLALSIAVESISDPAATIGRCVAWTLFYGALSAGRTAKLLLLLADYRHERDGTLAFGLTEPQLLSLMRPR
jgi:hypothetical protein